MLIRYAVLAAIGLCGGFIIGGGTFAFITMIGIFPRLAARTHTAAFIRWYENCIIIGGILGNIASIFYLVPRLGYPGLIVFGLFAGIFVGCLSMAIAEVLRVIPIFIQRVRLTEGLPWMILATALGRAAGSIFQLWSP